jgi:hypothetical protein
LQANANISSRQILSRGDAFLSSQPVNDVCYWPKADNRKNASDVAFGGKADMAIAL